MTCLIHWLCAYKDSLPCAETPQNLVVIRRSGFRISAVMIHPKRPHKKTRTGCQACKQRRVKVRFKYYRLKYFANDGSAMSFGRNARHADFGKPTASIYFYLNDRRPTSTKEPQILWLKGVCKGRAAILSQP